MKIILATNNANKVREVGQILADTAYEVISQSDAGIDIDVDETGTTFEENAALKAEAVYNLTHTAVIADDSGLSVDALDGEPGVYSARYGGDAAKGKRKQLLLSKLENVPDEKRTARFVCVICFISANGEKKLFRGECEGRIGRSIIGEGGFGYDPVFITQSHYADGLTFAQISSEEKNTLSHRGKALELLSQYLKENYYAEQ